MNANGIRILLIEDNPGDARLIREMLFDGGNSDFALDVADTLNDGLGKLDAQNYDVLLLDLSLPDSFGADTILTARARAPHLPIVVLTGWADESQGLQAMQSGAQDYLVKGEPDSRLLRRAIRYALERHRVEQALRRSEEAYRSLIEDVFRTSVVGVLILDASYHRGMDERGDQHLFRPRQQATSWARMCGCWLRRRSSASSRAKMITRAMCCALTRKACT